MKLTLYETLNQCTARISTAGQKGTGFFVAPGLVLTCAHVIKGSLAQNIIEVSWNKMPYSAHVIHCQGFTPVTEVRLKR